MPIFVVLTVKVGDRFDLLIALIDQAENFLIVLKSSMSSTSNNTERYSYHNLVVFWFYVSQPKQLNCIELDDLS